MKQTKHLATWLIWTLLAAMLLQGCSNEYADNLQQNKTQVEGQIAALGKQLDSGQLANTRLITSYSEQLAKAQPDLKSVTDIMAQDATTTGALYQGLKKRLAQVPDTVDNQHSYAPAHQELQSLLAASDPVVFNDSLLDVVNTLADLSNGELPRISIPRDEDVANVKGSGQVAGSYLVGNPSYGQWKTDSSGRSFWEYYGMYRLFSDLFTGPGFHRGPVYHDDWNSGRPRYSYHRDYGRSTYGSAADRNENKRRSSSLASKGITPAKPKKTYGSAEGRKRVSTYASMQKNYASSTSRKYGASGGPRHSADSGKRRSNLFDGKTKTGAATATSPPRRTSNLFGSSARSSSRSRGFGGK